MPARMNAGLISCRASHLLIARSGCLQAVIDVRIHAHRRIGHSTSLLGEQ
jgi:hypothetical protein